MKICICGGGSLGHVCSGVLSRNPAVDSVNLFTQQPERWSHSIRVTDCNGTVFDGRLDVISSNPSEAVSGCDMVFLCLPGYAIENTLLSIKPFIGNAIVGSIVCSTGFFFAAHRILGDGARLFGFQRTPFIARTDEYGHSAFLLGYKPKVAIAVENVDDKETLRNLVQDLWNTKTRLLAHHYEASLTNSNPILHTGRLYSMWSNWNGVPFDHNILFYKEWTDASSQVLIDMDAEFMQLLSALSVTPDAIPPLLQYYESHDASSLTRKISGIPAFQTITSPMKETDAGWVPDYCSRYFTEDFPYGLKFIVELAREHNVCTPTIDRVYAWGMKVAGTDSMGSQERTPTPSELRQRFNPDGSLLRCQQMLMLDMLKWFDDLCHKYDIQYWLCSGTLLGAVRHGGYIPWDDDLDISMMRKDYERLKRVMADMPDTKYKLQDNHTDPGYFFSYGKLRDTHSYLEETNRYDRLFSMRGVYIDLLTFEHMPPIFNKIACMSIGHSYKILNTPGIDDGKAMKKVMRIYQFNDKVLFPILRFMARLLPGKWLHRSPGIPYKSRTTKKEIFPLSSVVFEDSEFPAPHDTHAYLSRMFGNYMQLPDIDSIHPHSCKVLME